MNAEKFTQKSLDAVRTAKSMAEENRNNYITPEHLLYALVDQDGGLIPSLLGKMKVDCNAVLSELDTAIAALPKVGNVSEVYLSPECDRAINAAEKAAKERAEAMEISKKLRELTVTVTAKGGGAGKLFGSVTNQEIADALKAATGITLDKRKIVIADPIKNVGTYTVTCKLGYEISAPLTVKIQEA